MLLDTKNLESTSAVSTIVGRVLFLLLNVIIKGTRIILIIYHL